MLNDARDSDDLRVLDVNGDRSFRLFRFSELGPPIMHDADQPGGCIRPFAIPRSRDLVGEVVLGNARDKDELSILEPDSGSLTKLEGREALGGGGPEHLDRQGIRSERSNFAVAR